MSKYVPEDSVKIITPKGYVHAAHFSELKYKRAVESGKTAWTIQPCIICQRKREE